MRRIIMHLCLCLFLFSCSDDATETQTITLQTDGYFPAGLYNFVGIDTPGEEVAITLGPLSNSYQVTHIQFLFGGTGNTPSQRDVILKIYNDNGSVIPGSLIHSSEYTLANHNTLLQELDVSSENIQVTNGGSIRVGFEFTDGMNFPSFAQEFDGVYDNTKNWIKESNGTSGSNDNIGSNGNWVIRAVVEEEI